MSSRSLSFFLCAIYSTVVIVEASTSTPDYYAQTTGVTTWEPMITSTPDLNHCKACEYSYRVANFWWDDAIYNHTTAAVEIIIDDSINKTSTSTIRNANYTMLPLPDDARDVVGSVATLALDASTYYLTYPTRYPIHWGYSATFQTTTTLSGNGTSSVVCTQTQISYTEAFADDNSNSTTAGDALDAFTASNFKGCFANHPATAQSPSTKVRVSAITVTSTRHGKLPMNGTPATTTESITPIAYPYTSEESDTEPTIYFSGPVVHNPITGGLGPEPTPTEQSPERTGDAIVSERPQPVTQSPTTTTTDQPESPSPSQEALTPPIQVTVGSQTYTADSSSKFIIGTQTLEAGGPAITHDGHTLSLGSNIIIDSSTVPVARLPVITFAPGAASRSSASGSSTPPLGSIIIGGFQPISTEDANPTSTEPVAFTGGVALGKRPCIWAVVVISGTMVGLLLA